MCGAEEQEHLNSVRMSFASWCLSGAFSVSCVVTVQFLFLQWSGLSTQSVFFVSVDVYLARLKTVPRFHRLCRRE